jgi:hypothetical protein
MTRQTRTDQYFSPWELTDAHTPKTTRRFEIIQTQISLDALMQQSILDNDAHVAHLDDGAVESGDEGWEDEDDAMPPPSLQVLIR